MGLGDFLEDVGGAVADTATGLVHGAEAIGNVAYQVTRGAAWAAQPDHWDEIANGIGAVGTGLEHAGEFVWHHPGQAWDIGFAVGREVLKEELTPKNLAIDAGLMAASVFTGGGSGAALAARIGGEALKGARAVDEVVTGGRIARTAVEASRAISATSEAIGFADKAEAATRVLGYVPEKIRAARAAIPGMSEFGIRGTLADKIATSGAAERGEVGLMRGAFSDVVRGSSTAPSLVAGSTPGSRAFAEANYIRGRSQMYKGVPQRAQGLGRAGEMAYQAETHPVAFAMQHGGREVLQKAGSYAFKKIGKGMFDDDGSSDTDSMSYLSPDNVYQPSHDTPDLGMSRGYGGAVGGSGPDVSDETYTSSGGFAPISVGRGRSFYEGAGMANPYDEESY